MNVLFFFILTKKKRVLDLMTFFSQYNYPMIYQKCFFGDPLPRLFKL